MPVEQQQSKVILTHNGASVEILPYGATIVSWISGSKTKPREDPKERLFVSSTASLDGSKPVRGGIPIVFPCFGAPTHPQHSKLSQHGFARNSVWSLDTTAVETGVGVSVGFTLQPNDAIKAVYDHPFHLTYVVTLSQYQLSAELHVKNTSPSDAIEFQALFHNYIRAVANDTLVSPLIGKSYYDKTDPSEEGKTRPKTETRTEVDVKNFTDSVYEDAGNKYGVKWPGEVIDIEAVALKDLVIWNPQAEAGKKIADMEDDGWSRYVCVEPGHAIGFINLPGGETWVGKQVLTMTGEEKQVPVEEVESYSSRTRFTWG